MVIKESSKNPPVLIFMRHGARSFDGDRLSNEGKRQALTLSETLRTRNLPMPTELESSPKNRTQATLGPMAAVMSLKVRVDQEIDERPANETQAAFEHRVKKYLESAAEWAESSNGGVRLVCSHLDWLELAALFLTSDDSDIERAVPWSPLAMRGYRYSDRLWLRIKS